MTDLKRERDRKMRVSYEYARMGDATMATQFANSANQFFPVTKQQYAYMELLLRANTNKGGIVSLKKV